KAGSSALSTHGDKGSVWSIPGRRQPSIPLLNCTEIWANRTKPPSIGRCFLRKAPPEPSPAFFVQDIQQGEQQIGRHRAGDRQAEVTELAQRDLGIRVDLRGVIAQQLLARQIRAELVVVFPFGF